MRPRGRHASLHVTLLALVAACTSDASPAAPAADRLPVPGSDTPGAATDRHGDVRESPAAAPSPPPAPPAPLLELAVRSRPDGATLTIDGRVVGTTPVVFTLPATGEERLLALDLRGYQPVTYRATPVRSGLLADLVLVPVALPVPPKSNGAK
ncbi:MAG: PEGA domain-containing protein [Myxococcales bacterium]|nr:PEGA domain-containing protein [Myxococcales bacterium]